MPWAKAVEQEILNILKSSPVPEDYPHALNVREWVRRLKPGASYALQLAALAHDLERALPERKVHREEFADYDAFKQAHAENSARIVGELLNRHGVDGEFARRVCRLIRHHEFGIPGDEEAEVLKNADSLSFFEVNLPHYFRREGEREAFRRMVWGYRRLSPAARKWLHRLQYPQTALNRLMRRLLHDSGAR